MHRGDCPAPEKTADPFLGPRSGQLEETAKPTGRATSRVAKLWCDRDCAPGHNVLTVFVNKLVLADRRPDTCNALYLEDGPQ